jgi:multiple sugar transport system permease protein
MKMARYLALSIAAVLFLIPFYLVLRNGLASEQEITSPSWTFWPSKIRWENFADLFANPAVPLVRSLVNSVLVAVLQTAGQLLLCGLAGYGLARIPYRYANVVLYLVIATLMIPAAVTFVPAFVVVSTLGWISDLRGLVIPGLFSGFTTFLFRQYFLNFPREIEEAARMDGLGHWGTYWRVVVPNSKGFFAALVQVALSTFLTAQSIDVEQLFLAAAVSITPLVIVFVALQRFLVRGVTETGIKG